MPVILVDGVSTSGKSVALRKIQSRYAKTIPNYSKLIITEHFTERYFEDKSVSQHAVEKHIQSILNTVVQFKTLQNSSPFAQKTAVLSVYIERLLLTFFSRNLIDENTFDQLANVFSVLDCKHYLLTIPVEHFEARLVSSLTRRNAFWSEYITHTLGGIYKAVIHFQKQQEKMLEGNAILSNYMQTAVITVDDVEGDFHTKIE